MQHSPVKARCPVCGDITTSTEHVGVVVDVAEQLASISVRCPRCHVVFTDHLKRRQRACVTELISGGCLYSYP